jgi:hypothetical protein
VIALTRFGVHHPLSDYVNGMRSLDYFAILALLALPPTTLGYLAVLVRRFVVRRRHQSP